MNQYLKHLDRIEFVVTLACTGKCRHCSEGDHETCSGHIDPRIAAQRGREARRHDRCAAQNRRAE